MQAPNIIRWVDAQNATIGQDKIFKDDEERRRSVAGTGELHQCTNRLGARRFERIGFGGRHTSYLSEIAVDIFSN